MSEPTANPYATSEARLTGPSVKLDPRVNAYRADLADIALAGRVFAARYADPVTMRCELAAAPLLDGPDDGAVQVSQLLFGETFRVVDRSGDWVWGQAVHDDYVGWCRRDGLGDAATEADARVTVGDALVFAAPSIKAQVVATLPLNSRLATAPHDAAFRRTAGGFIHHCHVALPAAAPLALAEAFVGTPYRWGGRTRAGIDCSGLVQAVLLAQGIACPRDTDQQCAAFAEVACADRRRGDLVFFPGHVGLLVDRDTLLHANAHWMTTLSEPLADVAARLQPLYAEPVIGVRRPPCEGGGRSL